MKKVFSALISVVLAVTLCVTTCTSAFAASFSGKKYVKEMIISYGNTEEKAKNWLTNSGYEVLDYNLNEGADSTFSTKKAVYIGYKTTDNADEAITDMKLMNMKGGYSVDDYQMLLSEQKEGIQLFLSNFKVAVQEYRTNYNAGLERAVAAHDLLNLMYDDDTKQNVGDLLLNKIKEEYTDDQYNALSGAEKAKTANMTTILMQGNSNAVLAIEQIIAMATDASDSPWITRYQTAKTYDEMIDDLMDKDDLTVKEAQKQLATEYDEDAKKIAGNIDDYQSYLEDYINAEVNLSSSQDELNAYFEASLESDPLFDASEWVSKGTQYELLKALENDDISLYDLFFDTDYDVQNEGRTLLYPLVSVLTKGQRACLSFLPLTQLVMLGINNDKTIASAMEKMQLTSAEVLKNTSVYEGIDRTMFNSNVAMTSEAIRLRNATGKNAMENWTDSITTTSLILYGAVAVSALATGFSWWMSKYLPKIVPELDEKANQAAILASASKSVARDIKKTDPDRYKSLMTDYKLNKNKSSALYSRMQTADTFSKVFWYAGIAMTCITLVLVGVSIWHTYLDLKEYYNAEFTPIPARMVSQGVNDRDEKTYTYYKVVRCNREELTLNDKVKLLKDNGDLNGDEGRQWVALYTTKDAAAGDPITADFKVQYNNTTVPDDRTPLSMFGESTVQNLTNKKAGYTYADSKNGIYLFYGTDASAFAGSAISNGVYAFIGGGVVIIVAAVAFYLGTVTEKKKERNKTLNGANRISPTEEKE